MISIAIIEDDQVVRESVTEFLSQQPDMLCEYSCESCEDFFKEIDNESIPDVLLMDIELPGMNGINGIKRLSKEHPSISTTVLSVFNDPSRIFNAIKSGAKGYLLKNTKFEDIANSIRVLHAGGSPMSPEIARKVIDYFTGNISNGYESALTQKENEVVNYLVKGLSYKLIAEKMKITINAVRFHIRNIYRKLEVNSKAEVISLSLKNKV